MQRRATTRSQLILIFFTVILALLAVIFSGRGYLFDVATYYGLGPSNVASATNHEECLQAEKSQTEGGRTGIVSSPKHYCLLNGIVHTPQSESHNNFPMTLESYADCWRYVQIRDSEISEARNFKNKSCTAFGKEFVYSGPSISSFKVCDALGLVWRSAANTTGTCVLPDGSRLQP